MPGPLLPIRGVPGEGLAVRDVSVTFDGVTVLDDVSLRVAPGRAVAVVGPSGSGKSTLLACVAGLRAPDTGQVVIDGTVLSGLSAGRRAAVRRSRIGLVNQDADLLPELSVLENVAITLLFDGVRAARATGAAMASLEAVGLQDHARKRIDEISGGQAQRVAVARALVRPEVRVIVADEPTASLDVDNARAVTRLLIDRCRSAGVAAIVATHDPMVASACDHTMALRQPVTA
jgi:putative ABC transport system ATP-binding protein